MTGRNTFRRAKKLVSRGRSSRGSETLSTPIQPDSTSEQTQEENQCSGTQQSPCHSTFEHWDSHPIEEILEYIPAGVDAAQWCQLVTQWSQPKDKERAAINAANAKKQTCPHTMGRVNSVRRQKEMAIKDRLLLWRINRLRKDGIWSSEDAKQRWVQACELLAVDGLTPEDGNVEANERVFSMVMGPEHLGRVRTQGFGVTPT
ncbi:hypothetical protein M5K25_006685 [Dendrobium thyrsiflorum]|uniref:Uncharacterized protein n=1 Tax=Dendrobium thyrsiflorum TaxID=117978 RepID=A0ABD0VC97_DENTH